jgi:hypothetical protein
VPLCLCGSFLQDQVRRVLERIVEWPSRKRAWFNAG